MKMPRLDIVGKFYITRDQNITLEFLSTFTYDPDTRLYELSLVENVVGGGYIYASGYDAQTTIATAVEKAMNGQLDLLVGEYK